MNAEEIRCKRACARVFKTVCDAYDWRAEGKPRGDFRQAKAACLRCTMRHVWCVCIYTRTHTRAHSGIPPAHTQIWVMWDKRQTHIPVVTLKGKGIPKS